MVEVRVLIKLKEGVSDPEGANTLKALHLLGFKNVRDVKTMKIFDLIIEDRNNVIDEVKEMCEKLLINPVIHTYEIEVVGE